MRDNSSFHDVCLESPNGGLLFALINGDVGWLMYLRESGDAGFSSRNPDYNGPPDEKIRFRLSNGQVDEYPGAWTYPTEVIQRALEHFRQTGAPAEFIEWHNDSGDGEPIIPRHPGRSSRSH
ncbi:MAG TPA: Imm1 family immunity protein [Tepidisphaeraceae bacterium]|nr:Imm1 family immunity protein [Tepidisphaeraceae bacterium]